MFDVPVLFVIYNRIEETHDIFEVLHTLKPKKLYVAADGAKKSNPNDFGTCLRARSVIMPEWPCELKLMFKEEHVGKAQMAFQAINWFFEHESEGVILFDDTLPHPDFFYFCEQLLHKYRDNKSILHIGGSNFQRNKNRGNASYYFSGYATTWGFATWKDRWENFDLQMVNIKDCDFVSILPKYIPKRTMRMHWIPRFNALRKNQYDIWEYQYMFHLWSKQGYCITPNENLVTNIGFKNNKRKIRKLSIPTHPILPLTHPQEIVLERKADRKTFRRYYKRAFRIFTDWFNENILGKKKKH